MPHDIKPGGGHESRRILPKGELETKQGQLLTEERLLTTGIEILMETLGPVETTRFLSFPMKRRMGSLKRHQKWQASLEKDRFFQEVFGRKTGNAGVR